MSHTTTFWDKYLGALGARELRQAKGVPARYGLFQRLVRLAREVGHDLEHPAFFDRTKELPRTLEAFEQTLRAWKRRQAKSKAQEALATTLEMKKTAPLRFSTGQVATALGVSTKTVGQWCDDGRLGFERLPSGHRRIPAEALDAFRKARKEGWTLHPKAALEAVTAELVAELEAPKRSRRG